MVREVQNPIDPFATIEFDDELTDTQVLKQLRDLFPQQFPRPESGAIATGVAGLGLGTMGLAESMARTPETLRRVSQAVTQIAPSPIRGLLETPAPLQVIERQVFQPIIGLFQKGAEFLSRAREQLVGDVLAETALGKPFRTVADLGLRADDALQQAIETKSPSALFPILTDTRAWTAFVGQAVPSLVAAFASGGSLAFLGWMEGMEAATDAADFEKRTGQKISNADFAQAVGQAATINALLEKTGLQGIIRAARRTGPVGASAARRIIARIMAGLTGGGVEAGTEALQQINTNLAEFITFNPEQGILEGVIPAAMGGFGAGAGGAQVGRALPGVREEIAPIAPEAPEAAPQEPVQEVLREREGLARVEDVSQILAGPGAAPAPGTPAAARAAAEAGGALAREATEAPPGIQAVPSQVSTAIPPLGVSTAREIPPSTIPGDITILGEFAIGDIDQPSSRRIQQRSGNVTELVQASEEIAPRLESGLNSLFRDLPGVNVIAARAKARESVEDKIATGRPAQTISDFVGARAAVDNIDSLNEAIDTIQGEFNVLEVENFLDRPRFGYRAVHVQVDLGNGMSAELQFVPDTIAAIQEEVHESYDKWKRTAPANAAETAEFEADRAEAERRFGEAFDQFAGREQIREVEPPVAPAPPTAPARPTIAPVELQEARQAFGTAIEAIEAEEDPQARLEAINRLEQELDATPAGQRINRSRVLEARRGAEKEIREAAPAPPTAREIGRRLVEQQREAEAERGIDRFGAPAPVAAAAPAVAPPRPEAVRLPELVPPTTGNTVTLTIPEADPIEATFAVVEADDLVPSNLDTGVVNPDFPAELQPRDRSRPASQQAIGALANQLDPARLSDSTDARRGAPIIGPEGVVESGNARVLAIRRAQQADNEASKNYRQFLIDNAERLGLQVAPIEALDMPVLVRIRQTPLEGQARIDFVTQANVGTIAGFSATEQAVADARTITDDDLALFRPSEDGNVLAASNQQFIQRFIQRLGTRRAGALLTAEGRPSRQLGERITSAMFQRAYGDDRLTALQAEEADPDIRNIIGGLLQAAPEFARARAIDPELGDFNIIPAIVEATEIVRQARQTGQSVDGLLSQTTLFEAPDPNAATLARFMDANKRSPRRLGFAFKTLGGLIEQELAAGLEGQLLREPVNLSDLVQAANQRIEQEFGEAARIGDLFAQPAPAPATPPPIGTEPQPTPVAEALRPLADLLESIAPPGARGDPARAAGTEQEAGPPIDPAIKQGTFFANPLTPVREQYQRVAGRALDFVYQKFGARFGPLGRLPNQDYFLSTWRRLQGRLAQIDNVGRKVADTFNTATEEDRAAVYAFLTTRDAPADWIADPVVRRRAVATKRLIDRIGEALVRAGILSRQAIEAHRGEYLPRLYLKHLLSPNVQRAFARGVRVSDQGFAKLRKDIPVEIRELILGEIKDPAYLAARATGIPMRDMAVLEWFQQISESADWFFQDTFATWNGQKVSAFWLKAEAQRLRDMIKFMKGSERRGVTGELELGSPAAQTAAIADQMERIADPLIEAITEAPADFIQIPDTTRWGVFRGSFVRKEILNLIINKDQRVSDDASIANRIMGFGGYGSRFTSAWKLSKVALNPPTQIRNFVSNMVLLHLSGVPMHRIPQRFVQAIQQIRTNGKFWRVARRQGVTASTFAANELAAIEQDMLRHIASAKGKNSTMADFMYIAGSVAQFASDTYGLVESVGKTMKIQDAMEREGKSEDQAGKEANEALFDYGLVPPSVRFLRSAPIGVPFITFYYKALPLILKTAVLNPQRFVPYLVLPMLLNALIADDYDVEPEDVDALKAALPEWLQERGHTMFLPWKDENGRWQALDYGYFMPWSMYTELLREASATLTGEDIGKAGDILGTTGLFGGPIPDIIAAIKTNKDPFTRRDIANRNDPAKDQIAAWLWYMWRLGAPTFITDIGFAGHMIRSYTGRVNPRLGPQFGEPMTTKGQALARLFGINIYPINPELTTIENLRRMGFEIKNVASRMRRRLQDPNLSEEQRDSIRNDFEAEISIRQDQMNSYQDAIDFNPKLLQGPAQEGRSSEDFTS